MLTKKIWLLIGALTVLCAGVVGVNAYLSKKPAPVTETPEKITEKSIVTEPEESTSTISDVSEEISLNPEIDTSDWDLYKDEKLEISFEYPKEWHLEKIIELAKNGGWVGSYDYPGFNVWLNFVEEQFSYGCKQEKLDDFCDKTLLFPFTGGSGFLLNCHKIRLNADKNVILKGIIRDSVVCHNAPCLPGGPCGGEPLIDHCEYLRVFIINLDNDAYPYFVAGLKWGQQCYEDKCVKFKESLLREKLYSCFKQEYEHCKIREMVRLQTFDTFIGGVQTW